MNLEILQKKKEECRTWKNVEPWFLQLKEACKIEKSNLKIDYGDWFSIGNRADLSDEEYEIIVQTAKKLIPWRKGPFKIFDLEIDSEWQSNIKYNLIRPYFNLKDKIVADIGCNNGYYMFRMLEDCPKRLIGFDPSPLTLHQFEFINHFVKSDIVYEMLGVEHLEFYNHKFDFIFMLGVLYHRPDPVGTLKSLARGLNSKGEILIDTFMIDGDDEICLTPNKRYSKIPNIYFIPTIPALKNWLERAGFENIEVLATTITTSEEQRKTPWSFDESLEDFLDPNDSSKTVEGYPAPKRVYVKARKIM
ncbi:tRNA 5-methoxyuridine(34)/uridine 5-oxyacetic acid(34) synthase CmoB [Aliarcobacter butzleri]|uniref:tRNA 5-methoxyuridine(34)/uridine 5-oxyacetic acid(34) synthase CmoB n=2 Tax=Aliarcobacter butzleri TaxID=28197 RepID=A0AAW7PY19_9BACT|nr:tRNA 5-methoxyuridine(34)/uridine 5-oxyacetic acid(34) synthase CmoB [Aliarcobacter butzleri]KLE00675.1 tRNA methyltransferase [Aliarcobacter butzleri L348]MCG3667451.1 tRNA 5-methoxyuridine(34)/uridine 5-oxyacetic acid(34) synthase CmoB [Aliarcobacter butzleri]MCT7581195.1 tRNA 5-methoxyuridine(34)/uridine 5-oxyacetic acid(34) synthase CmoB [Aliarcobacter butzleri]MCT7597759.1 tRNA 5-methoxyuridine(34)/uridine 5-oxyacetic acid(34) synthase CmoB [Aliarcobacter butzleri]MDN5063784.1 tRNA 5-m